MRILVHAEWRPEIDPDVSEIERDEQWGEMVLPLFERAIALGGRLIGWSGRSLTVDFSWDGLYDAIDFLVDAPLAPDLAAGISHGELKESTTELGWRSRSGGPSASLPSWRNWLDPGRSFSRPSWCKTHAGGLGLLARSVGAQAVPTSGG